MQSSCQPIESLPENERKKTEVNPRRVTILVGNMNQRYDASFHSLLLLLFHEECMFLLLNDRRLVH